jgi:REP-associated tyrosine transposase
MTTHYHLLLETPLANLADGMKLINSCYAQGFNRRHKRVGALFQGRYHSVVIESERQFHHAALYIALTRSEPDSAHSRRTGRGAALC